MNNQTPQDNERETVKPIGNNIVWSDDDIEALSTITPADIADAKRNASEYPELNALLNAREER